MAPAEFDRTGVTGGKMGIFPALAAMPDRTDGMDHVFGRQPVSAGDLGIAGVAATERAAFVEQLRARGTVDGAINTAAAQQRRVGRVDDGVNAQCRNISDDDF